MNRMVGRVAIVTGGAMGIGAAIARAFVTAGARVMLADLDDAAGAALAQELGPDCRYTHTDVTSGESVQGLVARTVETFGQIDVLVNNAGVLFNKLKYADHSEEQFDRSIAVNLKGPWLCTRACFPHLRAREDAAVVNIASIAAVMGNPDQTGYGASKGGLLQLTRHTAAEGAELGIRANCISPGGIVTSMSLISRPGMTSEQIAASVASRNPLGRTGWPEDIAHAAVWLASIESRYVTGQNIVIDGGSTSVRKGV